MPEYKKHARSCPSRLFRPRMAFHQFHLSHFALPGPNSKSHGLMYTQFYWSRVYRLHSHLYEPYILYSHSSTHRLLPTLLSPALLNLLRQPGPLDLRPPYLVLPPRLISPHPLTCPSHIPHARHSPSIPAVNSPYLPHPPLDPALLSWPVTPFAFLHARPPRPACPALALPPSPRLLTFPPLASPNPAASPSSASPCPPRAVVALPSRIPALTLSPQTILTLPSHSPHAFLTPHLQATCLTLLPMQISRRGWRMSIVFASFRRPGWTKSKRDQCQQMVRGSARRCCSALMPS